MEFVKLTEMNLASIIHNYVDYYNTYENGCWTYEKAYKRIHQIMSIEDAECIVLYQDTELIGFLMGYYKEYDDIKLYYLEEIVIFSKFQNKGYGKILLNELEKRTKMNGASQIEFICINDEHHMHFYEKLGFNASKNLNMMGKHF